MVRLYDINTKIDKSYNRCIFVEGDEVTFPFKNAMCMTKDEDGEPQFVIIPGTLIQSVVLSEDQKGADELNENCQTMVMSYKIQQKRRRKRAVIGDMYPIAAAFSGGMHSFPSYSGNNFITERPPYRSYSSLVKKEYHGTHRNVKCPCGSGKKYKKCHGI